MWRAAERLLQRGRLSSLLPSKSAPAEALSCGTCHATASTSGRAFSDSPAATAAKHRKPRFYESVAVAKDPFADGYNVLLNKYPVRTPGQNVLQLPTYPLALAVAAEWEWLEKGRPVAHEMPLMSLAATAIDEPKERSKVVANLLKYIHTDASVIRYEPGHRLTARQEKVFGPLLEWAASELGWGPLHCTHSICGTTQSDAAVQAVRAYLEGLDRWHLAAVDQLTAASKSLVVAAAVVAERLSVDEAIALARLEEDFQMEDWGMVEAGHDLDIADMGARVAAPALLLRLLKIRDTGPATAATTAATPKR